MNPLGLIYVNSLGVSTKGFVYEFMFSENITDANGIGWADMPAASEAELPYEQYIDKVMILETTLLNLSLLQDSDYFSYLDGCDGVIAIAWEDTESEEYEFYLNRLQDGADINRLFFRYGESLSDVSHRLRIRGFSLTEKKM